MPEVIATEKRPIMLWLDDIEEGALQQAKNLANLPFAFHHIAIMPDAHFGYGMPIGGVLATDGMVIPNGVGVDIGCGVCALQTSLEHIDQDRLKTVLGAIRSAIPTGFKHHKKRQPERLMPSPQNPIDMMPIVSQEYEKGLYQLGTLGGGNHFIEIQKGSDGHIWIMIHSGSRNIGYRVANHYNTIANRLNRGSTSGVDPKWQLAPLPLNSDEGRAYLLEMQFCVDFAFANRLLMMERIEDILQSMLPPVHFAKIINVAHNYAAEEYHFDRQVIVHRKGATRAFPGEQGIIPGSQGSASFIVTGKGNRGSFCSSSHGAGRKLGRKQAQRSLNLEKEIARLDSQGIIHAIRSKKDLDEAAGAYKDIHQVLEQQHDLVDILIRLDPLAVVKG